MKTTLIGLATGFAILALGQTAFAADSKLQEIRDRGTIRACHAEASPWGIKDPTSGKWVGSDIEAAINLAETLKVKIEHIDSTWGTLIPSLDTNKCDIVMAPLFRTAERALRVLFADPAGYETQGVAVVMGSGISSYKDLDQDGKSVGVISGTADESFANRFFKKAKVKALVTDKVSTLGIEAANGRVDAVLTDSSTLRSIVGSNAALKLEIIEKDNPLNPQGYSYAISKGEYDFQQFINVWQINIDQQGLKKKWHDQYAK
jgi:ABC-type amino acid transport substrate-binding protein